MKKFVHFNTRAAFDAEKVSANSDDTMFTLNNVSDTGTPNISLKAIVFIKDTNEIWTHGLFYAAPDNFYLLNNTVRDNRRACHGLFTLTAETTSEDILKALTAYGAKLPLSRKDLEYCASRNINIYDEDTQAPITVTCNGGGFFNFQEISQTNYGQPPLMRIVGIRIKDDGTYLVTRPGSITKIAYSEEIPTIPEVPTPLALQWGNDKMYIYSVGGEWNTKGVLTAGSTQLLLMGGLLRFRKGLWSPDGQDIYYSNSRVPVVTSGADGAMSKEDKVKLDTWDWAEIFK